MTGQVVDGWFVAPCDSPSSSVVYISFDGVEWLPAFRDSVADQRVAKVRPPSQVLGRAVRPQLKINGIVTTLPVVQL